MVDQSFSQQFYSNLSSQNQGRLSTARRSLGAFNTSLISTYPGRLLKESVFESAGFHYEKGINKGFLGLRGADWGKFGKEFRGARDAGAGRVAAFETAAKNRGLGVGIESYKRYRGPHPVTGAARFSRTAATGMALKKSGAWGAGRFIGGTAFKALPIVMTAYEMSEGYKREGLVGAAKGFGVSVAYTAAFKLGAAAVGSTTLGIGLAIGAAAYIAYQAAEASVVHTKGLRALEMGGGHMQGAIQSHGASTMRQRSLQNLSNSHINGRIALGNEAILIHTPFRG